MNLKDQFGSVFGGLTENNWKEVLGKIDVDIKDVPYALKIKNISGYMEPCVFCKDKKCDGCPLPYTDA